MSIFLPQVRRQACPNLDAPRAFIRVFGQPPQSLRDAGGVGALDRPSSAEIHLALREVNEVGLDHPVEVLTSRDLLGVH
jgi:hypothetical protein